MSPITSDQNQSQAQGNQILNRLVCQLVTKLEAGETVDLRILTAEHPEHFDHLQELLPTLEAMANMGNTPADETNSAGCADVVPEQLPPGGRFSGSLGDYRIIRELGRGGMGVVYEAEQISLGRGVALKVLPLAATLGPQHVQRFKNEARAAATLKHPHIVGVYSVGVDRGVHYYAMELIEGRSLAQAIAELSGHATEDQPTESGDLLLSAETTPVAALSTIRTTSPQDYFRHVARLIADAADALDYAHSQGVVHRDIKPANLLIDQQTHIWVTDFGLARLEGEAAVTLTGDILGTLRYMSPEQAAGRPGMVDYRTDLHALGATLHELVTLRPAFDGGDRGELLHRIATETPLPLRRIDPRTPVDLETITAKAMEKDPADRYESAGEMAADLRAFADDRPITARQPSPVTRAKKFTRRHSSLVASALVLLALATILLSAGLAIVNRERSKTAVALHDAQDSLQFARLSVDQMYTQIASQWLADDRAITPTQRGFLEKALRIYQRLANEAREDPQSQWEAGTSYSRVARIQRRLGHHRQATSSYQRQIAIHQRLVSEELDTPDHRAELAAAYHDFGELHSALEKLPEALVAWNKAEVLLARLTEDFPNEPAYRQASAINDLELAGQLLRAENVMEAERLARTAVATFTQLQQEDKGFLEHQLGLYRSQAFLARVLRFQAKLEEAEKLARSAVNYCAARADESPDSRQVRKVQAAVLTELADVLVAAQRLEEGATTLRNATGVAQHSLRGDISPTAQMISSIKPEAEWAAYAEPEPLCEYLEIQIRLGVVLGRLGRFYEARQTLADAIRATSVLVPTYGWPRFFAAEANARASLAELLRDASHTEADAVAATAARAWFSLLKRFPSGATAMSGMYAGSDLKAFLNNFPEQRTAVTDQPPPAPSQFSEGLTSLGVTLGVSWYRQESYDSAVNFLKKFADEASGGDSYAWFYLAMALHQQGEHDQARRHYQQAVDWMHEHKPDNAELQQLKEEAARVLEMSDAEIGTTVSPVGVPSDGAEHLPNAPQGIRG